MLQAFNNAGIFLIQAIFKLYIFILLLRLILQIIHADYYNPVSQLIIKVTNPFVKPLQKIIPGFKGIDFAIILLLFIFAMIKLFLTVWMRNKVLPNVGGISIWSIGMLLKYLFNIFFYALLIRVILSWLGSFRYNAVTLLLGQITDPLLVFARKKIPPFRRFDFSPLVVLLVLQLVYIIVANPIIQIGMKITLAF